MHPKRKQRLIAIIGLLAVAGAAVGLVIFALGQNINHFYTPAQINAGEAPLGVAFRVGGIVEKGSVKREGEGLTVRFNVELKGQTVPVEYTGILPDLFREGQGIVALGKMNTRGVVVADEVLAKHDENYMPAELADELKKQHNDAVQGE